MCEENRNKLIYQNNFKIDFDEIEHKYFVLNKELPSVSSIIRSISNKLYSSIPKFVLDKASKRGTEVHKAIEMFEEFGIEPEDEDIKSYLLQYRIAKKLEEFTPLANELRLTNGEFCGTLDMVAKFEDMLIIIDTKTTSKINDEVVSVQLAGYLELALYNGIDIKKTYILHLSKKGYKLVEIRPNTPLWEQLKRDYINAKTNHIN